MLHPLVILARRALQASLRNEEFHPGPPLSPPQACFVSLKINRRLRGCMGTICSTKSSLEEEVMENALAAAKRDPRFDPVRLEELEMITFSIDLLSPLEPVETIRELDPARYGLVVRSGDKAGVLLPDLPNVKTPQKQVEICRNKGGIGAHEEVILERFTVERITE